MDFPMSRLVVCVGSWARADDVSRTTTDRPTKRPTRESWNGEAFFSILRFYELTTFAFGEVIIPAQTILYIYPSLGRIPRNVWLRIPLSSLVARTLTSTRAYDVSRMTDDGQKRPTRDSRGAENVQRFYEFTNL